jgi:hypothetical protein
MSRSRERADRINQHVDIIKVLYDYGYRIHMGDGGQEQQFSCDLHGDGRDSKPSARVYPESKSWYCVDQNERILTANGWMSLREGSGEVLDGTGHWETPIAFLDKGTKDCVRLETNAGYSVTLTPDHQVEIVDRGWITVQEIEIGDVVVVPKPIDSLCNPSPQLPIKVGDLNSRTFKGYPQLNLPDEWSLGLGEALGYIFGDGWVTPRSGIYSNVVGLTSSAEDVEDARRVFHLLQEWAAGRGGERHRTDISHVGGKAYKQDQYVFTIGNNAFCEWFQRLGFGKEESPNERPLPPVLWSAPFEAIRGFLRGIFATDGSVYRPKDRKSIRVTLYSVSERFLLGVQLLLLQLGIHCRVHRPAKTRPDGVSVLQLATGLDILAFRERIGIANSRKQEVLDSFECKPNYIRPFQPKVSAIVPVGKRPVADLSMPGDPSFVAGGIKVHNCFACHKSRDAIATVMAKENCKFHEACSLLERKLGLPALPWEEYKPPPSPEEQVAAAFTRTLTFEDCRKRVERFLQMHTDERTFSMNKTLGLWEYFDQICWQVEQEALSEDKGKQTLEQFRKKVQDRILEIHAQ